MKGARLIAACLALGALAVSSGCLSLPGSPLADCQSQNRMLAQQRRALEAEIASLTVHKANIEDKLFRTEDDLRLLEEEVGLDRGELAEYRQERSRLQEGFRGLANVRSRVPPEVAQQLVALCDRFPDLHYDPVTGISKLDTDVLFDSGRTELKPGAEQFLAELAAELNSPEAADLKIVVVGHTDDERVAGRTVRNEFPNNFHLSTSRALAVADSLCRRGLAEQRIGVSGFAAHEPIAPNASPDDRRKNRRVEVFVMGPDVPVVGWTDSIPSLY